MTDDPKAILQEKLEAADYDRLTALDNPRVNAFVADAVQLCQPAKVLVVDDSEEMRKLTREKSLELGEEKPLEIDGHTVHWDGPKDQGRDREATKYLVPEGDDFPEALNQTERESGLDEVRGFLKGAMKDRTMIVRFLSLGPTGSEFSLPCIECTDSFYVSHSLDLLYRPGYEQFKASGPDAEFFATLHSCGRVNERMVSVDVDKRRIYIDHTQNKVYSVNTQYAGNTVGLKKLALRLSIRKAAREGWLAEHMFLMAVTGPGGRKSYFAGAFPSACGKTSTAMLPGEAILGDDIAYFRAMGDECRAVNAEAGVFGIIQNVNEEGDPTIWKVLTNPGEVIFSNILVNDGKPYWLGMGQDVPETGANFVGEWQKGMVDDDGKEIPCAHKNARYAVKIEALDNADPDVNNPDGVPLGAILYGGRDAKSYVPCQQSYDWDHGIIAYGASLETETTFATVGKEGVPEINVMSIQDFVAIPLGEYVNNNLAFGRKVKQQPTIFGVNYFLRDTEGNFLNGIRDKHVWIKWMEQRIHGEVAAAKSPTGLLPLYEDLKRLFKEVLGKEYTEQDYIAQFTIRVPENLGKIDRVETFHRERTANAPERLFEVLAAQRDRLVKAQEKFGDYISPLVFKG